MTLQQVHALVEFLDVQGLLSTVTQSWVFQLVKGESPRSCRGVTSIDAWAVALTPT